MPKAPSIRRVDREETKLPFMDRDAARAAFWEAYKSVSENRDSYEVIAYYGPGGTGKTTLIDELITEMGDPEKIPGGKGKKDYISISLEKAQDKEMMLRIISNALMENERGLLCPIFDAAFKKSFKIKGKKSGLYSYSKDDPFKSKALIKAIASFFTQISIVSLAKKIFDLLLEIISTSKRLTEWLSNRNETVKKYKEEIKKTPDANRLIDRMHIYLKFDIEAHMAKRKRPFVFFIDAYEDYVDIRDENNRDLNTMDQWLRDPIKGLVGLNNTIWVISGREKPRWDDTVLPDDHIIGIDNLSEEHTKQLFRQFEVREELIGELFRLTRGNPLFIELCIGIYYDMRPVRDPQISDFGKDVDELVKRYLRNITPAMEKMIYIITGLPNVWDYGLAEETARKMGCGDCVDTLKRIVLMSIVNETDDGYKLHKNIRDILTENARNHLSNDNPSDLDILCSENFGLIDEARKQALLIYTDRIISAASKKYIMNDINQFNELFLPAEDKLIDEDSFLKVFNKIAEEIKLSGDYNEGERLFSSIIDKCMSLNYSAKAIVHCQNIRNNNLHKLQDPKVFYDEVRKTKEYADANLAADDKERLTCLHYFALHLFDKGDYEEAAQKYKECHEARIHVLGSYHLDTIRSRNNRAVCLSCLGRYKQALKEYEVCFKAYEKALKNACPESVQGDAIKAARYSSEGQYEKAIELYEKCRKAGGHHLKKNLQDLLMSLNNLASGYSDVGDYKQAFDLYKLCYDARVRLLKENHPDTLHSLNNLAVAYDNLGDHEEVPEKAEDYYKEALKLKKECCEAHLNSSIMGRRHPHTLHSLNNLAVSYSKNGDCEEALQQHEECYEAYKSVLGDKHPDTLRSLNNLATAYVRMGDNEELQEKKDEFYNKALDLYFECKEARTDVLGAKHPDTVMTEKYIRILLEGAY